MIFAWSSNIIFDSSVYWVDTTFWETTNPYPVAKLTNTMEQVCCLLVRLIVIWEMKTSSGEANKLTEIFSPGIVAFLTYEFGSCVLNGRFVALRYRHSLQAGIGQDDSSGGIMTCLVIIRRRLKLI